MFLCELKLATLQQRWNLIKWMEIFKKVQSRFFSTQQVKKKNLFLHKREKMLESIFFSGKKERFKNQNDGRIGEAFALLRFGLLCFALHCIGSRNSMEINKTCPTCLECNKTASWPKNPQKDWQISLRSDLLTAGWKSWQVLIWTSTVPLKMKPQYGDETGYFCQCASSTMQLQINH